MKSSDAAAQLKLIIKAKECPAVVVITSPDAVRRERALRYVLDHFAGKSYKASSFTCGEQQGRHSLASFIHDIAAPSLFEPIRYAVIKNVQVAKAQELEPLVALLQRPPESLKLFIVSEGMPNSGNFKKALEKTATILDFEELKGAELRRWTERELRQNGVESVSDEVVELVVSLAGDEPQEISRILEKFTLYLDGETATTAALRTLTPSRPSASDFDLADSLTSGKRVETELLVHNLLAQGSSPFMLIGLLTKTFMTLYRIRALLDRGVQQQAIRADLGITPWLFNKYLPAAQKLSTKRLESSLRALLRADFSLKDRSLGPAAAFSTLCHATSRSN